VRLDKMRKSLAPVSGNTLNSRNSMAPRASLAPGKMGMGRQSVLGGSMTNRKSSIGARQSMAQAGRRSTIVAGVGKQMDDPRNVKDKMFLQSAKHRLIEFLVENSYDRQISLKQLEAPSTKDFLHILEFLYKQIDPRFSLGANVAEDVPLIFKRLKYPFNISKSHLQAVGSPHAWPSLLAALNWIVELLQYEKQVEVAMAEDLDAEHPDKMFFDYLARAYESFLQGNDDDEQLETELAQAFETKNQSTQEEVERVTAANAKMEEEILTLTDSKLETLQEKRNLLIKDLDKFKLLIENLNKHLADVEKKTAEIKADAAAKEVELKSAEVQRAELQEVVGQQEVKAIDAQRIAADRTRLQDDLKRTANDKEELQSEINKAEIVLANKQAEIEKAIQDYNRLATELKIVPITAKHAEGIAYDIPVASRGNGVEQLIALSSKHQMLRGALENLREQLKDKAHRAQNDKIVHEEKLKEAHVRINEKKEEVKHLESEYDRREAQVQKDKEILEQQLRATASEVQALEEMVANGTTTGKARLQLARKKVEELEREVKDATYAASRRRAARVEALMALCNTAAQHKLSVQDRLKECESKCLDLQSKIATS
jgi:kinetochore protein NDC80